jgi:hypothetical protein
VVEAEGWDGPAYQACRDAAFVSAKFELSRRRDNLTFKHHREVAALLAAEADALLDWAEETIAVTGKPRPTCELLAEVYRRRPVIGAPASERTCTIGDLALAVSKGRKWGCIYAERAAIDDALTEDRTPAKSDIIGHVRGPETEPVPLPDLGISRWRRLGAGCAPP